MSSSAASGGALAADILLPVSKADQEARGVARAHACVCGAGQRRADCPAHAALGQMALLRARFPERFGTGWPDLQLPFFPQLSGEPATKQGFADTVVAAAEQLQMEASTPDSLERFTGHSLRAT